MPPGTSTPIPAATDARSRLHAAVFHAAWIVLLLWGAWWRFSLPLVPAIDRDYGGFLNPALMALAGHPFQHMEGRNFLYPSILYALLAIGRDFRVIAIVQHLLGLATGGLLLATWCAAGRALRPTFLPRWLYDAVGLGLLAVFLFSSQPAQFEFLVRPDVLCPFFAALDFFLLVRFLVAWKLDRDSRATFWFGATALFVSFVLPNLKPSFWLTTVFATVPVWWYVVFGRREKVLRRLLMAGLPVAAAYLLFFLPEKILLRTDTQSASFLPESIFSIHALIIREQIVADIATPDPEVPYSTEALRSILDSLDATIASARMTNPTQMSALGYDADWLLYHYPFFTDISQANHWKMESLLHFCRYYYQRAWKKQTGAMLRKIGIQLGLFYNLKCPAYCDNTFRMEKYYRNAYELLQEEKGQAMIRVSPLAVGYNADLLMVKDRQTPITMSRMLRRIANWLGNAYLPLHLAWLAALPWLCWRAEDRRRFGVFCAILAVGYAFNFGNNLGIAVLHTLQISRYTYVQFATTLLTEMLTAVFC